MTAWTVYETEISRADTANENHPSYDSCRRESRAIEFAFKFEFELSFELDFELKIELDI